MILNNDYLTFLHATFDDFEGATIVKLINGEYFYANARALKLLNVNHNDEVMGKHDSDFELSDVLYGILNYERDVNFINYTGIKKTFKFNVLYQRINIIDKGEVVAKLLNLSFTKNESDSYFIHANGSITVFQAGDKEQIISPKEVEIIKLIIWAYTSQEIADRVNLSYRTIEKYRCKIFAKFGCKNKSETIKKIFRTGMINHFID
ncbi:MAG: helix-turn-helix transcriptional regulator [Gammaproteobacteria bacterium]|nr:helix-turn-helix transcriptional regulator [Gammaproteobacteria bacterium]